MARKHPRAAEPHRAFGHTLRNRDLLNRRKLVTTAAVSDRTENQMELPRSLLAQEKEMIEAALKEGRGWIFGPKGAAAKLGIRSALKRQDNHPKLGKLRIKL